MKIRIKGASVRLRLSKTEVSRIARGTGLEEETPFAGGSFYYALDAMSGGDALSADFSAGRLTVHVPQALIQGWDTDDRISIDTQMPLENGRSLYLLLEKDFQCLDATGEDQTDNYINPAKIC